MPPRPTSAPLVAMESDCAWATPAPKSNSRATTLAARAREFMLGKLRGWRKIGLARCGRRGTLGGVLVGCQDSYERCECAFSPYCPNARHVADARAPGPTRAPSQPAPRVRAGHGYAACARAPRGLAGRDPASVLPPTPP